MDMYRRIEIITRETLRACVDAGAFALPSIPASIPVEKPKRSEHGDFATTICLQLAKEARRSPREIAKAFLLHLSDPDGILDEAEVAGPGFINFTVRADVWREGLRIIGAEGEAFGRSNVGRGRRVLVEFVSANPTGPLHVGHGRGAVLGDTVASLLEAVGYEVEREYYINDVGNQMAILGRSLFVRYQQACGRDIDLPSDHYVGDYVKETAERFLQTHGEALVDHDYEADPQPFIDFIKDEILDRIRTDLDRLGVRFDRWFSERTLHEGGRLERAIAALGERDHVYTDDEGRKWLRSSELGDDEDRVLVRDNGLPTYFAADVAYHQEKFERGYDLCIDVWGADHHGYVARVKAALRGLGIDPDRLEILLYQFVSLVSGGQPVRMSTRAARFETLEALLDDVGGDVTRCNFVMRKSDAQFEFDLDLAKTHSLDNPVFYVQYGHARICTVLEKARENGHEVPDLARVDLSPLELPEEIELIKKALEYPWVVRSAAESRGPHHLVFYLQDLIGAFHSYYTRYRGTERVISDDAATTAARLALCEGLRLVLASALGLLGVSAPERMAFSD